MIRKPMVFFFFFNGSGALEPNEGNLGPDDSYGFDEKD